MAKRSKSYEQAAALVDREKLYSPLEAVKLAKQTTTTKRFDSTVEVAMRLGVDPRRDRGAGGPHSADQCVEILLAVQRLPHHRPRLPAA